MVDFYTPVLIPRGAFEQLVIRVDRAVGENAVALVLNEDFPFRGLDPIDADSVDFSDIKVDNPEDIVENLDQLLYFALEDVPNDVISSWASEGEGELKEEAVQRVQFIRENMPELTSLWQAKSDSIIPPLAGFAYETSLSRGESVLRANIYLSASRVMPGGRPDKSDMVRLRVQLWPSDIRLLIRELEHLWEAHLDRSSDKSVGDEGDAIDDQTNSQTGLPSLRSSKCTNYVAGYSSE